MSRERPACAAVVELWDAAAAEFLKGGSAVPPALFEWSRSYAGRGVGEVTFDAMPEPYLGRLDGNPSGVLLALNPGKADMGFQGRGGVFAREIAELGSYAAWAATWPYLREPWVVDIGRNRHHSSRLEFLRRWYDDPRLDADAMVGFELFPWHSTAVKGAMRPDPATIETHVLAPLREIGAPVFAFGAEWLTIMEHRLHLRVVDRLGRGGRDYGSAVASRAVVVFEDDAGLTIVAESHTGGASPPNPAETRLLRDALEQRPDTPPPPSSVSRARSRPAKSAKPPVRRKSCPTCFTQLPLSGTCGTCA